MSVPERPPPPIAGKVNHHSIELHWEEALNKANEFSDGGDSRVRVTVQEEDRHGQWGSVYTGYAKRHGIEGLDAETHYRYRIRFQNNSGISEWSAAVLVATTREPLTGVHLHKAVAINDVSGTERVLQSSEVSVEVTDKYGFTPLMQAAQKGFVDIIEVLLKHGADVDNKNDSGKTALMMAAYAGQLGAVQLLRDHGANYEHRDKGGSAALHWATDGQNIELIEWMVENGADVNIRDTVSHWTPLLRCAAVTGNRDVAKVLLKNGAAIDAVDVDGKTALMVAVINGHQPLVDMLLQHNVDIRVQNAFGKTAYEMAVSMDRRRIAKSIEEHMGKLGMKITAH